MKPVVNGAVPTMDVVLLTMMLDVVLRPRLGTLETNDAVVEVCKVVEADASVVLLADVSFAGVEAVGIDGELGYVPLPVDGEPEYVSLLVDG